MNAEFSRPSPLLDKLMEVDWRNEKLIRALAEYAEPEVIAYPMEEDGRYLLRVENAASMRGNTGNTVSVTAVLSDGRGGGEPL